MRTLLTLMALLVPTVLSAAPIFNEFAINILVQDDGTVAVHETMNVDFNGSDDHGIYRDIPYRYRNNDGSTYLTEIRNITTERNGRSEEQKVTRNDANIRIRIGDAAVNVAGPQVYTLKYLALGALQSFEKTDELTRNALGSGWEAPVKSVRGTVSLPETMSATIKQTSCYVGPLGNSDQSRCVITKVNEKTVQYVVSERIEAGEAVTISVGYTSGIIPTLVSGTSGYVGGRTFTWAHFFLVLMAGGLLYWSITRTWARGRLEKRAIMPEYDVPQNLKPAEIGMIQDVSTDTVDISATLVDLARRGHLTITKIEKKVLFLAFPDYELTHTGNPGDPLDPFESRLLNDLFARSGSIRLSDLVNTFAESLTEIKRLVTKQVDDKGLTLSKRHTAKIVGGVIGGIALTFGIIGSLNAPDAAVPAALALLGVYVISMSLRIISYTESGKALVYKIQGYKLFLSNTGKYRQPFLEEQGIFEKLLPYAMIFGVSSKLGKAFEQMGIEQPTPTWYIGTGAFNLQDFSSGMSAFERQLSTTMASTPSGSSSGGGGFSGGGFGGGGGGGW